jgi:hypothetical protein
MSYLVGLYENYLKEQTEDSVARLFEAFVAYDFSEYHSDIREMGLMRKEAESKDQDCVVLQTNGSSNGTPSSYEFRPCFFEWVSRIEPFLRGMHSGKNIFLCSRLGNGMPPQKMMITEVFGNSKKNYETNANLLDGGQLVELFEFVEELHDKFGKVNFTAFPDVWNMLFSNPLFNELCEKNREKIGCFVNNDFEMLFTSKTIYIRDQMINWRSGLNFFTCESGHKHFLPIFNEDAGCTSLINIAGGADDSDCVTLRPEGVLQCPCGRPRIPIEIVFHHRNCMVDRNGAPIDFSPLRDSLKGRYATFQIHQDEKDRVTVFLTPIGGYKRSDLDVVHSFFSGLEISFEFNRYFEVGSKRYCFWRSERVESKDFKLQ